MKLGFILLFHRGSRDRYADALPTRAVRPRHAAVYVLTVEATVDLRLELGAVSEQVEVTASAPSISPVKSTIQDYCNLVCGLASNNSRLRRSRMGHNERTD